MAAYNPRNGQKYGNFAFFFNLLPLFLHTIDLETCANKPAHQNTPLGSPTAPYMGVGNSLQLWKWPYPALEMLRKVKIFVL